MFWSQIVPTIILYIIIGLAGISALYVILYWAYLLFFPIIKLCKKEKIPVQEVAEKELEKKPEKVTGTQKLLEFQKELRENATQAEKIFYKYLEDHRVKFEFQKILCPNKCYIVDFFLNDYNVIVEIDGGYHDTKEQQEKDWQRSLEIYKHFGYKTFRLKNCQLIHNHFEEKLINFLRKNASKQRSS